MCVCVWLSTAWLQMWEMLVLEESGGTTVFPGDPAGLSLCSEQVPVSLPPCSLGAAGNQLNPLISSPGLHLSTYCEEFSLSISI